MTYLNWLRRNSNHDYCKKKPKVTGILRNYSIPAVINNLALPDDDDEDELAGIENNNPPGHAELPVDDQVDDSTARTMLFPLVETDEDDDDDDASSTALGLAANGSDAPPASTTALDHPVDGSDAHPASTTALGLPADGSDLSEEGVT